MHRRLHGQLILLSLIIQLGSMLIANGFMATMANHYVDQQVHQGLAERREVMLRMVEKSELSASEIADVVTSSSYEVLVILDHAAPSFTTEQQASLDVGDAVALDSRDRTAMYFLLGGELIMIKPVLFTSLAGSMVTGGFFNNLFIALLAFALMGVFARRLTSPLTALTKATRSVASGDFETHVEPARSWGPFEPSLEVAELTDHFNLMISELQSNEYLRRDFTSNVSHELKTPIASIVGYASVLILFQNINSSINHQSMI